MIGSHNSFTYLPVKKWWMGLLSPWHRCQKHNVYEQYSKGVRCFDLRIKCLPYTHITHNNISYIGGMGVLLSNIQNLSINANEKVYLRILLDIRKAPSSSIERESQERGFSQVLEAIIKQYPHIEILEAAVFYSWQKLKFTPTPSILEYHYSVMAKWYEKWMGPRLWNYVHRKERAELIVAHSNSKDTILLLDFI